MSAPSTTPVDSRTDAVLWRDLATMLLNVGRALDARLQREAGISLPDFDILGALCTPPAAPVRPRDLGLGLRWEKSRLSHQLRRMEARGLVDRSVCAADGRGALVGATAAGRTAYERARPGFAEELHARFGRLLEPGEGDQLYALVQRVLSAVDLEDICGPTPGC
jgi:DNA-binding MarR family transcriptional regulator